MAKSKSYFRRVISSSMLLIVGYFFWKFIYANYFYEDAIYARQKLDLAYPILPKNAMTDQIARGEYLIRAGNCITCHTKDKSKPFAGGVHIDTPYGYIPSTNITPDTETGIGNWVFKDFVKAMQDGISPKGKHYYPAFPYNYFAQLTSIDLLDMYAYLRTIPPMKQENETPQFPLNLAIFRWAAMPLWDLFAGDPIPFNPELKLSPMETRGDYLVNGLGHCGMCHTTNNSIGIPKTKYFLSGAFIGGYWAPNINKQGLKDASVEDIVKVFSDNSLLNEAGPLAGPMADVSNNSLKFLTEVDQQAIAAYLKKIDATPAMAVTQEARSDAAIRLTRGEEVYFQVCRICHQHGRASAPKVGSAGNWFNRIVSAGSINTLYERTINGFNNMPALGGCVNCTDNDVRSAVNYMLFKSLTPSQRARLEANNTHK